MRHVKNSHVFRLQLVRVRMPSDYVLTVTDRMNVEYLIALFQDVLRRMYDHSKLCYTFGQDRFIYNYLW